MNKKPFSYKIGMANYTMIGYKVINGKLSWYRKYVRKGKASKWRKVPASSIPSCITTRESPTSSLA